MTSRFSNAPTRRKSSRFAARSDNFSVSRIRLKIATATVIAIVAKAVDSGMTATVIAASNRAGMSKGKAVTARRRNLQVRRPPGSNRNPTTMLPSSTGILSIPSRKIPKNPSTTNTTRMPRGVWNSPLLRHGHGPVSADR